MASGESGAWIGDGTTGTEGAVASAYYDFGDSSAAPDGQPGDDDDPAWGHPYVTDIIASCWLVFKEPSAGVDGIIQQKSIKPTTFDTLVPCFKRDPDATTLVIQSVDTLGNPIFLELDAFLGLPSVPTGFDIDDVADVVDQNLPNWE
jgi:hypothetical protein